MTVESLVTESEVAPDYARFIRPEPLPGGGEPEERLVLCGMSWERYLAFDKALGDDRSGPRFYYLDEELEVMSTSGEHERIKKWLAGCMDLYFQEADIEIMPRGQATMRLAFKSAGAEPDESWCLGEEKKFPDLVLEIALTSGGIRKLDLYLRFQVPEVWIWRRGKLEIYALNSDGGKYERLTASRLLADLDVGLLERCVGIASWRESMRAFRNSLKPPN